MVMSHETLNTIGYIYIYIHPRSLTLAPENGWLEYDPASYWEKAYFSGAKLHQCRAEDVIGGHNHEIDMFFNTNLLVLWHEVMYI